MSYIEIEGGEPLKGQVKISGFKNAALPILYATLLVNDIVVLGNIPNISDVWVTLDILREMGAVVTSMGENTYEIDTRSADFGEVSQELIKSMRGSYYLLGAEMGRFGRAKIGEIGGCNFGTRPIDQHIKAFRALGATVNYTPTSFVMCANKLSGNRINFDTVSVGATINAVLCAVLADGRTVLSGAAREPHVSDLCNFLNKCGAKIYGIGTQKIIIDGVESLHGCEYRIISDMIEAATYMTIGTAIGDGIDIISAPIDNLGSVIPKLTEAGADIRIYNDGCVSVRRRTLAATDLTTGIYPAFPTDMQPQFCALMCMAQGESRIEEKVWHARFRYAGELAKMGADITVDGDSATVRGVKKLYGTTVEATDLRAGAALIIAALCADGKSRITSAELVKRGYDGIADKLASLGASVYESVE